MNKTVYFYKVKFEKKEEQYNKPSQLPAYFGALIGDKKDILIAELGAGPVNTIGNQWPDTKVTIFASDILQPQYQPLWDKYQKIPIIPIVYEDMEKLTYADESFDIVHCVNALDHTLNLHQAIAEMKRVCKKGGWVYLRHAQGQKTRYRGMHHHDFETINLPEFSKSMEGDLIVNLWQKT